MSQPRFDIIDQVLEYNSALDPTNAPEKVLVAGSQNVLINRQRKVQSRGGYTRLGASNSALTPIRSALTWHNSTGGELPVRFYDDELEVYLGTVDGIDVDAWTRIADSWSTTEVMRFDVWWDTGENLDQLLLVVGNANHYKWGGGAAVISSGGTNTLIKKGTNTWAQNRFYTTGTRRVINARTGVAFTYTGGETTATLTGVTPDPAVADIVEDDVFVQQILTHASEPAASRNNHTIKVFENQVFFCSEDDNEVYVTSNDDTLDTAFSSTRVAGEGALLTLDGVSRGFGEAGDKLLLFAGNHSIWKVLYTNITVSTTLAELLSAKKLDTGANQGALSPDAIVQVGSRQLVYLTNEPALRLIDDPDKDLISQRKTLSNPIKPDFDSAVWTNAVGIWHKNALYIAAQNDSRLFILEFIEDAQGRLRTFWQPPQILPVRAMFVFDGDLYCGSNSVAETYQLFDGLSDTASDDSKIPINAIAKFAYRVPGDRRGNLFNFDEYYVDGEIQANTEITVTFKYGWDGSDGEGVQTIDGSDDTIIEGNVFGGSLGQTPLGQNPLGGLTATPADALRFRQIVETPKNDFDKYQVIFSTNDVDRFWAIISHGPAVQLSKSRHISIRV